MTTKEEDEILKVFLKNKVFGTYRLAEYLIKKHNIQRDYEKQENIFDPVSIKVDIQRILKEHTTSKAKYETITKIRYMVF